MPRIPPKNPRNTEKNGVKRCGGNAVAGRGRHCRCMGCATIASHNASISCRRSLGSLSTTPCPKIRRAHPSRPALPNTHIRDVYTDREKKRERQGEVTLWRRSCVPAYVRARFVLSATIPVLREGRSVHTPISCDIVYIVQKECSTKEFQSFNIVSVSLREKCGGLISKSPNE